MWKIIFGYILALLLLIVLETNIKLNHLQRVEVQYWLLALTVVMLLITIIVAKVSSVRQHCAGRHNNKYDRGTPPKEKVNLSKEAERILTTLYEVKLLKMDDFKHNEFLILTELHSAGMIGLVSTDAGEPQHVYIKVKGRRYVNERIFYAPTC